MKPSSGISKTLRGGSHYSNALEDTEYRELSATSPRRGHSVSMESVSVATLRSNLSGHLAAVK